MEILVRFESLFYLLLFIILLLTALVLIIYLLNHLLQTYREYKYYKDVSQIEVQRRAKILFNYNTIIKKDIILICILFIENVNILYCGVLSVSSYYLRKYLEDHFHSSCIHNFPLIGITYMYPELYLLPFIIGIGIISQFLLPSFLLSYLTNRYYGYSLRKQVIYKYMAWWSFQVLSLSIFFVPWLQIGMGFYFPSLLLIDWVLLVLKSRDLSRAIRAVLHDITNHDFDQVRYRNTKANYNAYRVFVIFHITSLFLLVILIFSSGLQIVVSLFSKPCYLEIVYNVNITLNSQGKTILNNINEGIFYSIFVVFSLYSFFLIAPNLIIAATLLVRKICLKSRINGLTVPLLRN